MKRFLIVNPSSGTASPSAQELLDAAEARGIEVHLLRDGEDVQEVARQAGADVLGMAGGDGSLAAVAEVALAQDVPATRESVRAAIDGEPARLETPLELRVEPRALRVLVPPAPE